MLVQSEARARSITLRGELSEFQMRLGDRDSEMADEKLESALATIAELESE